MRYSRLITLPLSHRHCLSGLQGHRPSGDRPPQTPRPLPAEEETPQEARQVGDILPWCRLVS